MAWSNVHVLVREARPHLQHINCNLTCGDVGRVLQGRGKAQVKAHDIHQIFTQLRGLKVEKRAYIA